MLKSLPVSHSEELVAVLRDSNATLTNPIWENLRDRQDVFSGAFSYGMTTFNLTNGGEARRVYGDWVSGDFFSTLGVRPVAGRTLARADDYRGCPGVAAISDAFRQSEYGGSESAIGKNVDLDGHPFQIVGVIDPAFFGMDVGQRVHIYVPLCAEPIVSGGRGSLDGRSNWWLQIVGRPKPGITRLQLEARLATLSPGLVEATLPQNWPASAIESYKKAKFTVDGIDKGFSELRTTFRKALFVLMAVVGIVLLIACANVANLLLARATTRQREIAVRLALGAGRGRLVRQLMTESILLALIGATLGVFFAVWGSHLLVQMMSTTRSALTLDLNIDLSILAFTIAVATATGVLFGLAPAWRTGRVDPHTAMKAHGRGIAEGHSRFSIGKTLVVAQIALSLVLVAGAGLLLGSWRRLANTDPGFKKDQVLLIATDIRTSGVADDQHAALYRQVLDRLRALPGVRGASTSQLTPISGSGWNNGLKADGFAPASRKDNLVWMNEVSDGYFATMGTPLLAGRDFGSGDIPSSSKVAIINEAMAKRVFGQNPAVGRNFRLQEGKDYGPPIEIIGVVGNAKYRSIRSSDEPTAYVSFSQNEKPGGRMYFEVRSDGSPLPLIPSIKAVLAEVNPRFTIDFTPLERQVSESLRLPRTLATLSGFFGSLALLLATIGLYGIMSYSVTRRRNEIGVRIALGAAQSRVVRMVVGEVGRMVVAGIIVGTLLTLSVTRLVSSFLYGVKPTDPATMVISAAALAIVAVAAAMLPAWRAARIDPVSALRED
jgi:predicted permease